MTHVFKKTFSTYFWSGVALYWLEFLPAQALTPSRTSPSGDHGVVTSDAPMKLLGIHAGSNGSTELVSSGDGKKTSKMANSPPKINMEPEVMEVWKMIFLFKQVIFRFHVSFRECIPLLSLFVGVHLYQETFARGPPRIQPAEFSSIRLKDIWELTLKWEIFPKNGYKRNS